LRLIFGRQRDGGNSRGFVAGCLYVFWQPAFYLHRFTLTASEPEARRPMDAANARATREIGMADRKR
jgi:hypothetical protein